MKRADIASNKRVFEESGKEGMEASDLTWRGFESIQEGYSREERARSYARLVVQQYKNLAKNTGMADEKELRLFAKSHSKDERQRAHKRAQQDAKAVKKELHNKTATASSPVRSPSGKGKLSKGVAKRMQWFQRSPRSARIANDFSVLVEV